MVEDKKATFSGVEMVSKDQAIGWVIFLACVVVAIGYLVGLFLLPKLQFWLIAIPVVIAFILVLAIGGWIGWTMATTAPPRPIEEIEAEEKKEEPKAEASEEKKTE